MSANAEIPQMQGQEYVGYKSPPLTTRFQPGQSGNPGGFRKNNVRGDLIYQKLAAMKTADLRNYEPENATEDGIKQCILRACDADDWQKAHAAIREFIDRLDGKATQRKEVEVTVNIQERREINIKAYYLLYKNKSDEEIRAEAEAVIAARRVGELELENQIRMTMEADAVAIGQVWGEATERVRGGR